MWFLREEVVEGYPGFEFTLKKYWASKKPSCILCCHTFITPRLVRHEGCWAKPQVTSKHQIQTFLHGKQCAYGYNHSSWPIEHWASPHGLANLSLLLPLASHSWPLSYIPNLRQSSTQCWVSKGLGSSTWERMEKEARIGRRHWLNRRGRVKQPTGSSEVKLSLQSNSKQSQDSQDLAYPLIRVPP